MSNREKMVASWMRWIAIGIFLTALSVRAAYNTRGHLAYGGEWMVLPLILIIRMMIHEAAEIFKEVSDGIPGD